MALNEYTLSVNTFLEPDVKAGPDAVCKLLVQLLLLEPNTFDTHPEMGVGIVSRYRYSFLGHADELQRDFQNQITKYVPVLTGIVINVREFQKMYYITATFNKTVYVISVDEAFRINTDYRSLDEIMGG